MGDVIGYKGTPEERFVLWKCMSNYRNTWKLFDNRGDSYQQQIANRDQKFFNAHLNYYIKGDVDK